MRLGESVISPVPGRQGADVRPAPAQRADRLPPDQGGELDASFPREAPLCFPRCYLSQQEGGPIAAPGRPGLALTPVPASDSPGGPSARPFGSPGLSVLHL